MPVSGNTRIIAVAKQTVKGTPIAAPTVWFPINGDAALSPNREIIQLPEADASAQRADNEVVGASPGGGWQGWWRDAGALFLSEQALGAIAAGVATPTQAMPYFTAWDVIPGEQCTRFTDCRIGQLTVRGSSMQGIEYQVGSVMALSATLGVAQPTLTLPTGRKFAYPTVAVSVGGVHPGTHDSFEITINRNLSYLRGDNGLAIYDTWPGVFEVTGSLVRWMEDDTDYRKVEGGAAAATALTTTIFTESLEIALDDGTDSTTFESAAIEYTDITQPYSADGAPIVQTLAFNTKRQPAASIGDNLTITVA